MNIITKICAVLLLSSTSIVAPTISVQAAKNVSVAFIAGIIGDPFYNSMQCGARDAAKAENVSLTWTGPTEWDIAKQQPLIDAAVQNAPDGMVIAPTDPRALITQIQRLVANGTPVVTVDGSLEQPVEIQNIQSNQYAGGIAAAEAMKSLTGLNGSFLVVGLKPGVVANDERVKGFTDNFGTGNKGTHILPILYPETSSAKASELVAAAILSTPDLKGIYATHFAAASGAASAILQAGKQGKIKLIAFDAAPQQVRDLRDGIYDALIVQEPYTMGYDAVKLIAQLVNGEVKVADVKHDKLLNSVIATRKNMNDPDISKYFYVDSCN